VAVAGPSIMAVSWYAFAKQDILTVSEMVPTLPTVASDDGEEWATY
jgi:hypothetical protein